MHQLTRLSIPQAYGCPPPRERPLGQNIYERFWNITAIFSSGVLAERSSGPRTRTRTGQKPPAQQDILTRLGDPARAPFPTNLPPAPGRTVDRAVSAPNQAPPGESSSVPPPCRGHNRSPQCASAPSEDVNTREDLYKIVTRVNFVIVP